MNRRDCLIAAATATGSALTLRWLRPKDQPDLRPNRSRVAILHVSEYSDKLDELVYEGLQLFRLNMIGKSVLLKPNLAEHIPGKPVNTDAQLIGATVEAFRRLGAAATIVGEGPWSPSRHRIPLVPDRPKKSASAPQNRIRRSQSRRVVLTAA